MIHLKICEMNSHCLRSDELIKYLDLDETTTTTITTTSNNNAPGIKNQQNEQLKQTRSFSDILRSLYEKYVKIF